MYPSASLLRILLISEAPSLIPYVAFNTKGCVCCTVARLLYTKEAQVGRQRATLPSRGEPGPVITSCTFTVSQGSSPALHLIPIKLAAKSQRWGGGEHNECLLAVERLVLTFCLLTVTGEWQELPDSNKQCFLGEKPIPR